MFMFLAAATFMITSAYADHHHDKRFGYFFLTTGQTVDSLEPVEWNYSNSILDDEHDIQLSDLDPTKIILKHQGYYRVRYSLTLNSNAGPTIDPGDIQFALYLYNGSTLVDGTTYAVGNAFVDAEPQLNGQQIIQVLYPKSSLQLVNQCEFVASLISDAGTDDTNEWGPNVSASILIEKLADLD
jgi:hypothetical protein